MPLKQKFSILVNIVIAFFLVKMLLQRYEIMQVQDSVVSNIVRPSGLVDLNGESTALDQKPAVLVFWASWCGPCTLELARIRDAIDAGELAADGIVAVAIWDEFVKVKAVAEERKYNFRVVFDGAGEAARQFKIKATPTTAFIDRDGRVSEFSNGLSLRTVGGIKDHLAPNL